VVVERRGGATRWRGRRRVVGRWFIAGGGGGAPTIELGFEVGGLAPLAVEEVGEGGGGTAGPMAGGGTTGQRGRRLDRGWTTGSGQGQRGWSPWRYDRKPEASSNFNLMSIPSARLCSLLRGDWLHMILLSSHLFSSGGGQFT
jgi:hypothetical protein